MISRHTRKIRFLPASSATYRRLGKEFGEGRGIGKLTCRHSERAKKMVGFVASKIAEWRRF